MRQKGGAKRLIKSRIKLNWRCTLRPAMPMWRKRQKERIRWRNIRKLRLKSKNLRNLSAYILWPDETTFLTYSVIKQTYFSRMTDFLVSWKCHQTTLVHWTVRNKFLLPLFCQLSPKALLQRSTYHSFAVQIQLMQHLHIRSIGTFTSMQQVLIALRPS